MVWKSWGGGGALLPAIAALLLLASAPPLCLCSAADDDVAVGFSAAPRRISRSPAAAFAFRVTLAGAGGGPCADCTVTCQLDGGRASDCGGSGNAGGNGTATASYAGLHDGSHTLAVCASRRRGGGQSPTCATYAWNVDTVPPTASISAGPAFTSAPSVSALVSFTEPCPGAGGFVCNDTYCNLMVYGPGRVEPSTLRELRPGLLYSVAVAISPDAQYGRIILLMGRGFCTDAAGHPFTRTANSTFTLRFGTTSRSPGASVEELETEEPNRSVRLEPNAQGDLRWSLPAHPAVAAMAPDFGCVPYVACSLRHSRTPPCLRIIHT